jgi:TRAP-type mannitol/chloroaromatic compound transport system permease small subunit
MGRVLDLIDRINTWIGRGTGLLVPLVALTIIYEIVTRHFFRRPTVWANEFTVFACALVYLLAGAWLVQEDRHVRIDLLHDRFGPRGRALLGCLCFPFFVLYVVVMLWASVHYTAESIRVRETTMSPWNPPLYPMKVVMTLGFALVLVQGLAGFLRDLHVLLGREAR